MGRQMVVWQVRMVLRVLVAVAFLTGTAVAASFQGLEDLPGGLFLSFALKTVLLSLLSHSLQ